MAAVADDEATQTRVGVPRSEGSPIAPGTAIGRYVVRRELGRGGVGVVLEAYDPQLDRVIALKLLIAGRDARDDQLRRFLREARAASSLRHPNIVPVHDLGEVDGRAYFAMDRIEGHSLGELIETGGALPPRRALEIGLDVARALDHAHARGIVHRDVKPENVLIDGSGRAFLTDFGLARDLVLDARLTATGDFVGTPAYASPEHLCGKTTDARSDIYSLGATLFEAVTGTTPFDGDHFPSMAYKILNEPPPAPRTFVPNVARDVESVILACLEKEPERRYASSALLAADIERFLRGEGVRARPSGILHRTVTRARRHLLLVAAGVFALASATAAGLYMAELKVENRRIQEQERELDVSARRIQEAHRVAEERIDREDARRAALALLPLADTRDALAAVGSALALDPDYAEGHVERAVLCRRLAAERRRAGDLEGARLAAIDARAAIGSALAQGLPRPQLLQLDAEVCRRDLRDLVAARAAFERLAASDSPGFSAYGRARIAAADGRAEEARRLVEEARVALPTLVPALYLEAELVLARDPARSLVLLDSAPLEDAERFTLRARALEALGRDGSRDRERARELDPSEPR